MLENKKVLIMASGFGSNFEAIIKHFKSRDDICFKLLTNNKDAYVIKRAKKLKIPCIILNEQEIKSYLKDNKFDLVILAGYMKILDFETVKSNTFINIHPSFLPKYKGLNAIKRAFINKEKYSGITIHMVNENIDDGEIIYQKKLEIKPNWDLKTFEKEIHKLEHFYYPRIIELLLGLNVLVVGSGAREHCICQKITNSKFLNKLYLADCNDGFKNLGTKVEYKNLNELASFSKKNNINLVLVGSETYFNEGIVDIFKKEKINIIGLTKNFSRLETSKLYAKKIMQKYKIKTAPYKKITKKSQIKDCLKLFKNPIIKADGLAFGKGCYINDDISNIKLELSKYLDGKYQKASKVSLVEERLFGNEASLFSFFDGENIIHFPLCKDFKQNAKGQNTGGLASICPISLNYEDEIELKNYKKRISLMIKKEKINTPFILYSGLMFTKSGLYVLEYNIRLGDPETEVLLNYVKNDWLKLFFNTANKMLDYTKIVTKDEKQFCIVVASKNYPDVIKKGVEIKGLEKIKDYDKNCEIYFSNVKIENGKILSDGGRVLAITGANKGLIFEFIKNLDFEEKMFIKI